MLEAEADLSKCSEGLVPVIVRIGDLTCAKRRRQSGNSMGTGDGERRRWGVSTAVFGLRFIFECGPKDNKRQVMMSKVIEST